MTTGTKVALLVGGLVLVGGGIAFAVSRSKKTAALPPRQMPQQEEQPQDEPVEQTKKKKGAILPVLGGLFVAGGTYLALKKKKETGEPFTTIQDNEYGYI